VLPNRRVLMAAPSTAEPLIAERSPQRSSRNARRQAAIIAAATARAASMAKMKDEAIVGNIGHFDDEIDMAGPKKSGITRITIRPRYDEFVFRYGATRRLYFFRMTLSWSCGSAHDRR
jgi:S-adenosyl-L-homocysteine hydrolase, NAD binding domain